MCASDAMNGDHMPCVLQRVAPDKLSSACAAAIAEHVGPAEEDKSLRGTFWKDGKRQLTKAEREQLEGEDKKIYNNWWKRKQKKMGKSSDVQYAIKQKKKGKATQIITHRAMGAARKELDAGKEKKALKAAYKLVKKECKKKEDLSFSKDEMKAMAKAAVKLAKKEIANDAKAEL